MSVIFTIVYIIGLALIGIVAGFASGLLGVGGGFLIVPLQLFLLKYIGLDTNLAMLIALGTSLAIIIPTSLSGAYRHTKELKSIIKPGIKLGIFGIIGGFIGGRVATVLPGDTIEIIFGFLLLFIAIHNFITINKENKKAKISFSIINCALIGLVIGFLSGLLGVGGGMFIIVALTVLLGFSMIEAIGVSSIFIFLTAWGGMFSYIVSGWGVNTFPYSLGYVSIVNLITIALFSVPCAYIGAKISHDLPEKRLKQVFSIVVLYIGLKMIGILP